MKKKSIRFGALMLALMLALSVVLTACSSTKTPEGETGSETSQTSQSGTSETGEQSSEGSQTSEGGETAGDLKEEDLLSTLSGNLTTFTTEGREELDTSAIQTFLSNRGGMSLEIGEVHPEEMDAEQEAAMDRAMRAYVPSTAEDLIVNNSTYYYFYEQLNPEQQELYDAMYLVAIDPTTTDNIVKVQTSIDPSSNEFGYQFGLVQLALGYDHPELWWIYLWNGVYDITGYIGAPENGKYVVYLQMNQPYTTFEADVKAFNEAVNKFMSTIDDKASEREMALQVHDQLIEWAIYDYNVLETGKSDLAHTAFGPLVRNSAGTANYCVCDGYSLAYTYLLQQLGMKATVVTGMIGENGADGGHAWSIVMVDGKWMEVDSTWDDFTDLMDSVTASYGTNSLEYQVYSEMLSDVGYMDMVQHYLFMVETQTINHYYPSDDLTYYTKDGMYWIKLVGESVRERFCDFSRTKDTFQGGLTALLPIADGTLVEEQKTEGGSTENSQTENSQTTSTSTDIVGTWILVRYNNYSQADMAAMWGDSYYLDTPMLEIEADGEMTLYDGDVFIGTWSLDRSILTFRCPEGTMMFGYSNGNITFGSSNGDSFVFGKLE